MTQIFGLKNGRSSYIIYRPEGDLESEEKVIHEANEAAIPEWVSRCPSKEACQGEMCEQHPVFSSYLHDLFPLEFFQKPGCRLQ